MSSKDSLCSARAAGSLLLCIRSMLRTSFLAGTGKRLSEPPRFRREEEEEEPPVDELDELDDDDDDDDDDDE
jgi:hypothetical protein